MIVDSTSEKERLIAKLYVDQSDPQFVNTECFEEKRQIYHCTELFELILERSMVRQLCIEGSLLTNDTSVWLIAFLRRTDKGVVWNYWIFGYKTPEHDRRELLGEICNVPGDCYEATWKYNDKEFDAFTSTALQQHILLPPVICADGKKNRIVILKNYKITEYASTGQIVREVYISEKDAENCRLLGSVVYTYKEEKPVFTVQFGEHPVNGEFMILYKREVPCRLVYLNRPNMRVVLESNRNYDTKQRSKFSTQHDATILAYENILMFYSVDLLQVYQKEKIYSSGNVDYKLTYEFRPLDFSYATDKGSSATSPQMYIIDVAVSETADVYTIELNIGVYGNTVLQRKLPISILKPY